MYITVLDYASGKIIIEQVEDIIDYEDYVSDNVSRLGEVVDFEN
jgi:hypothetical protein